MSKRLLFLTPEKGINPRDILKIERKGDMVYFTAYIDDIGGRFAVKREDMMKWLN